MPHDEAVSTRAALFGKTRRGTRPLACSVSTSSSPIIVIITLRICRIHPSNKGAATVIVGSNEWSMALSVKAQCQRGTNPWRSPCPTGNHPTWISHASTATWGEQEVRHRLEEDEPGQDAVEPGFARPGRDRDETGSDDKGNQGRRARERDDWDALCEGRETPGRSTPSPISIPSSLLDNARSRSKLRTSPGAMKVIVKHHFSALSRNSTRLELVRDAQRQALHVVLECGPRHVHEADDLRAPARHALCRTIGYVVEFAGRKAHPRAVR